jgi:glutaredoxin
MQHTLILYGKPDCHLCHAARDLLMQLQHEYTFTFDEVSILSERALEEKYRYDIPVIVIDSPIMERELRAALL